jgi:hypothetical protein
MNDLNPLTDTLQNERHLRKRHDVWVHGVYVDEVDWLSQRAYEKRFATTTTITFTRDFKRQVIILYKDLIP